MIRRRSITKIIILSLLACTVFCGARYIITKPAVPLTQPPVCQSKFGSFLFEDLEKITSYKFPDANAYLNIVMKPINQSEDTFIYQHEDLRDIYGNHVTVPALVTGASANHFTESQNLVRNLNDGIRKYYKKMPLFFFDLGLTEYQRKQLEETCNCVIKRFPFELLPDHVAVMKGYAWKPISLQLVLNEYPFAMWLDSSVRFTDAKNLTWVFDWVKRRGVLASDGYGPIAARTSQQTFQFLEELPCLFRKTLELEATFIAVHQNKFIQKYFMIPWVSCALSLKCMVLDNNPKARLACTDDQHYHTCHRFDQSMLSILMQRLFHENIERHRMKHHTFFQFCKGGEEQWFFPKFINDLIVYYKQECF